jgi:hypothetical protein
MEVKEFKLKIMDIHAAIHDKSKKSVAIGDKIYQVRNGTNGCRYLDYLGVRFMEQSKTKTSVYAEQARMGAKITWGMNPGTWIRIHENSIFNDRLLSQVLKANQNKP